MRTQPQPAERYRPFASIARRNLMQEHLEVPALIRALGLPRGGRILEVGCGRGMALPPIAKLCEPARLVGLDVDAAALADARRHVAGRGLAAELVEGDVRAIPFPDASFDVVVDFGTCFHISRPEQALAEITRVLAPGGWFVYETPVSQLLSHPVRSFGRRLPWRSAPSLTRCRGRLLWGARRKAAAQA
jgi:ubiquinone/menaquinone biosynthesis C-methylase UbiE